MDIAYGFVVTGVFPNVTNIESNRSDLEPILSMKTELDLSDRRLGVIRYLSNCQLSLQYNFINIAIYCFYLVKIYGMDIAYGSDVTGVFPHETILNPTVQILRPCDRF